jgi:hypothetical protein
MTDQDTDHTGCQRKRDFVDAVAEMQGAGLGTLKCVQTAIDRYTAGSAPVVKLESELWQRASARSDVPALRGGGCEDAKRLQGGDDLNDCVIRKPESVRKSANLPNEEPCVPRSPKPKRTRA